MGKVNECINVLSGSLCDNQFCAGIKANILMLIFWRLDQPIIDVVSAANSWLDTCGLSALTVYSQAGFLLPI